MNGDIGLALQDFAQLGQVRGGRHLHVELSVEREHGHANPRKIGPRVEGKKSSVPGREQLRSNSVESTCPSELGPACFRQPVMKRPQTRAGGLRVGLGEDDGVSLVPFGSRLGDSAVAGPGSTGHPGTL